MTLDDRIASSLQWCIVSALWVPTQIYTIINFLIRIYLSVQGYICRIFTFRKEYIKNECTAVINVVINKILFKDSWEFGVNWKISILNACLPVWMNISACINFAGLCVISKQFQLCMFK